MWKHFKKVLLSLCLFNAKREFSVDWTRIFENVFYDGHYQIRTQWLFGCFVEAWCYVLALLTDVYLPTKLGTTNPSLPAKWSRILPLTGSRSCVKGEIVHRAAELKWVVGKMKMTDGFIQHHRFKRELTDCKYSYYMISFYCKYCAQMYLDLSNSWRCLSVF